jgi:hypothetical protein
MDKERLHPGPREASSPPPPKHQTSWLAAFLYTLLEKTERGHKKSASMQSSIKFVAEFAGEESERRPLEGLKTEDRVSLG